ncbi:uncharacterized protein LOC131018713 [Salvia miltiorrhiza]|uniref:uncharacterized protein LOC131018713 n=1 Tax=Salvia miltiorrhiza TaxID=226208 RepID=UPI0025AD417A|nr:uncharacterized protein LOC131018713 [Salvia miltiorrhiza]
MEETKNQIVHRKLNLNVPPLSTRRASGGTAISGSRLDPANMVPFSWERIPGEPKDQPTIEGNDRPPPPKPPPARWRPSVRVDDLDHDGSGGGGEENSHSDRFDIFSLAESVDDVEGYCKATKDRSSKLLAESVDDVEGFCKTTKDRSSTVLETNSDDCCSSNFIIERFLPDAQALAEESVMNKKIPFSDSSFSRAISIGRSHQSMKGCGLGSLLPWKMKPKSCKVKSPVCDTIIGANLKQKR